MVFYLERKCDIAQKKNLTQSGKEVNEMRKKMGDGLRRCLRLTVNYLTCLEKAAMKYCS
jgi:hypothetical protein